MASREVGISFFLILFFYKLECTGGKLKKKKIENMKKKKKKKEEVPEGLFRSTWAVHRKQLLFKGGLSTNGLVGTVSAWSVGGQGFKSLTGSYQRL